MNIALLKGKWDMQTGCFWQKIAFLTDNASMYDEGKKRELFGRSQIKIAREKDNGIKAKPHAVQFSGT